MVGRFVAPALNASNVHYVSTAAILLTVTKLRRIDSDDTTTEEKCIFDIIIRNRLVFSSFRSYEV